MKYFRQESETEQDTADINMSPLIDMVFLLLIFFMVTTVFVKETGVDVARPTAVTAKSLEQDSMLFAISAAGTVFHAGQEIKLHDIRYIVEKQSRTRPLPAVLVADEKAPSGTLVSAIDQCKLGGAVNVSIAANHP